MALLNVNFHSDVLGMAMSMNVILPQKATTQIGVESGQGETCRVLYLLHGMSDDHTIWQRQTSIERYVAGRNMAVVMPGVHLSWYTDMVYGGRYQTYVAEELPAICKSMFRQFSDKREDTFIAGLSMGGYGALKLALTHPERYAACAGFSGAYDILRRAKNGTPYWYSIFGDPEQVPGSANDVYGLIGKAAASGKPLPRVYLWCGYQDTIFPESVKARDLLVENGYEVSWNESDGNHSWFYWDREIQKALDFFLDKK